MVEIERKFLVVSTAYRDKAERKESVTQGFLCTHPERIVRVRVIEDAAWLTVKGKPGDSGLTRFEWEHPIPVEEAMALLELCEKPLMQKTRYWVRAGTLTFEVDEFEGVNRGLVVAELELTRENEDYIKPEWLGEEVTGDARYYNSELIKNPYTTWKKEPDSN